VFANTTWGCLLISTTVPKFIEECIIDCCQTERQIQQDAWGSARIARVAEQCLYENCPQMTEEEHWPPNNFE